MPPSSTHPRLFIIHYALFVIHCVRQVFDSVSELVQSALDGYHVCLFSYGQTGAGKTHTMSGGAAPEQQGIMPRAVQQVRLLPTAPYFHGGHMPCELLPQQVTQMCLEASAVLRHLATARHYANRRCCCPLLFTDAAA